MRRILVLVLMISLLLSGLKSTVNVQKVMAYGTIYIRTDGSIDPSTAPITSFDNVTYVFIDNIYDSIVVERSGIVIDGSGFTLQGSGSSVGISIADASYVTVLNMNIENFQIGIFIGLGGSVISRNNIRLNYIGIEIGEGTINNAIYENRITHNYFGISIKDGTGNSGALEIYENSIAYNNYGVEVGNKMNCSFHHNNFINNTKQAITIGNGQSFIVWDKNYPDGGNYWSDYTGEDNYQGREQDRPGSDGIGDTPYVIDSRNQDNYPFVQPLTLQLRPFPPIAEFTFSPTNPVVSENIIFDASKSVDLDGNIISYQWDFGDGKNSTAEDPTMIHLYESVGNYNVVLKITDNDGFSDTYQTVVTVERMKSQISITVDPSQIIVRQSATISGEINPPRPQTNVTIWHKHQNDASWNVLANTKTDQNSQYYYNWIPSNTGIYELKASWLGDERTLANESMQIYFTCLNISSSITISTSSTSQYTNYKISLTGILKDMYSNPLAGETMTFYYTLQGNTAWTPIASDQTDGSGKYTAIWTPPTGNYIIKAEWQGNATHSATNQNVALSNKAYNNQYVFTVESNSTLSELTFDETEWTISFNISGLDGTTGYAKITTAKNLAPNPQNIKVYFDGTQIEPLITSAEDSWILTINYTHSTHQLIVELGPAPTPTPTPPMPTPSPTPIPTPTPTPTPTASPEPTPTPEPTPAPTPTPPMPTPSPTPIPTPTPTPTPTASPEPTPTPEPTPAPTSSPSPTPAPSPTTTPFPTFTPSPTPIATPTPTPGLTPSPSLPPSPTSAPSPSPAPKSLIDFADIAIIAVAFATLALSGCLIFKVVRGSLKERSTDQNP